MWWDSSYWSRYDNAAVAALSKLGSGPIAREYSAATFEADQVGIEYTPVGPELYDLAKGLGMVTLEHAMHTQRDGERLIPPRAEDRELLQSGLRKLYDILGKDCTLDHTFMRLESPSASGKHAADFGGKDVIAVNFDHAREQEDPARAVARTVLHELGHHFTSETSADADYHSVGYVRKLIEFVVE
jgi:hypothetical protein